MRAKPEHSRSFESVLRVVGKPTYDRGRRYARDQMVEEFSYDQDEMELAGSVLGSGRNDYRTTVYLDDVRGFIEYAGGDCSCPVGGDCKHSVALMLTALDVDVFEDDEDDGLAEVADWELMLEDLLDGVEPARAHGEPLALQISIESRGPVGGTQVLARLARPGKNGWINGNMAWSGLAGVEGANASHLAALRELYSVYQAGATGYSRYVYGAVKDIDLTLFQGPRLWQLLEQAREVGVELVHTRKGLGPVAQTATAEFAVDVLQRPGGDLSVAPSLRVPDAPAGSAVIAFLGAPAHCVAYVDRVEDLGQARIGLARLDSPVSEVAQRLLLNGMGVPIPVADAERFAAAYYPRLGRTAPVRSSDHSYSVPEIAEPMLALRVDFGAGDHRAELLWRWAYRVGERTRHVPLYLNARDGLDETRDVVREREIRLGLDLPLEEHGLLGGLDATLREAVALDGVAAMRFATELLPALRERADVEVEVLGAAPEYREAGDTLQIGVSADSAAGERDWFDLSIDLTVEGKPVPLAEVITALAHDQSHLLLPGGAYISLDRPELRKLRDLVAEARELQDKNTTADPDGLRISRFQAGLWEELAALGVVERQAAAWQRQVRGLLDMESVPKTRVPKTLQATLRPYQVDGFRWLAFLWTHQLGGILADDMGLGKTLQSLALICHARAKRPADPPFLILAPTSVVPNWAAEAARFAPHLNVVAITETFSKSRRDIADVVTPGVDVVITSHTLFRLDFEQAYSTVDWSALLIDEAQFAKNHQSKFYQCARRLDAPMKVAITGTPMENNLMELWALLSISAPGLFPNPKKFTEYYRKPIESGGHPELLGQLRRRVRPLLLRRTKELVASDLPAKQEQVLEVDLHPKHRRLYDTQLQRERQKILGLIGDLDKNRFTILQSLTLLRQLSLDAALIDDAHAAIPSAKIEALLEQIADVAAGGHRALVFSQFTSFLARVRARLDAEGVRYCYLDGNTRNRGQVLEEFKTGDAPVFLISLKSGGFGLNLTEADYCFLLDPWWNPATEAQAVDRTHRIGQTRNVMVYRLIARGTIEDKVMALKAKKSALFASVLDEGDAMSKALDADDIRELLR